MPAGNLRDSVKFQEPVESTGAGGVVTTVWTDRHQTRAQLIYQRGSEVVEAARLEGRPIYKVKIRSCVAARAITTDYRMIDLHRVVYDEKGKPTVGGYAVIEVDAITDPMWVFVVIEGGKAA